MSRVGHLIVGPAGHGVVEVALATARGTIVAVPRLSELSPDAFDDVDVIHTHYTDRLFGSDVESSAATFSQLLATLPRPVTVTLHDLPLPGHDPLWRQRRETAYALITRAAAGVVVSSAHEAASLAGDLPPGGCVVIPLPIDRPQHSVRPPSSTGEVAVLGWIYPGKGHAEVLAALPRGVAMVALGSVSPGHDDLAAELRAAATGCLRLTGYLTAEVLDEELRQIAVPVAPHHNVSASASVGTWLSAGRRPLVADGPWARELAERCPDAIRLYARGTLATALSAALENPDSTWLGDTPVGPSSAEVASALESFALGVL